MAQPLSDIYNSLNAAYNPQRDLYNQQLGQVDQQSQAAISGLNQQKVNAFNDITNQANANGMFYSGAPVQEEQRYTGGTYLPALANIQNNAQNQKFGLQQALAGVGVNQTNQANSIYQTQLDRDQQQAQFNQQLQMQQAQNQAMLNMYKNYGAASGGSAPQSGGLQADLVNAFSGFGSKPKYYTENTIIPAIANAYFGGNQKAAAQVVYQYRKANLGQ